MNIPWTKEKIISTIQTYHLNNIPLNFKYISSNYPDLRKRAEKVFGSWGEAIDAAGLDYDKVKKNKGMSHPFLAEDGILYPSQTEGLVANELYLLKNESKIIDYQTQQAVVPGKEWTCDFVITLLNGAKFWLEIDSPTNSKKVDQLNEKIEHYKKASLFYYKVSSANNIKNIIERFTGWFTLPIQNCVITAHKNPDGDALASMAALYNYITKNGKQAVLKIGGEIPKNLQWIIDDIEVVKKIPDWAEILYVLDCAPIRDRIGWEIPQIPIYNIDHHNFRIEENDPDNNVHVIDSCSTAAILFSRFGLKDDILAVGVYTDTFFTKKIYEVLHFLLELNLDEQELFSYISRINTISDKKLWDLLNSIKIHRCRNGFTIAETEVNHGPDIIEGLMQILMKLSESVCLIYGREKSVKLRTSNQSLDVSELAKEYGGGGHEYAAMCRINGKISEFKSKITSLVVPKNMDGYEEREEN